MPTDITDAGQRLKALNDRLDELRTAADLADVEYRAEIASLRAELTSCQRHMELTEAAWLRETCGNSPVAILITDAEREAVKRAADLIDAKACGDSSTLRGLLDRTQTVKN